MNDIKTRFAEFSATARKENGLSLRRLAILSGVSYMSLHHWERGEGNISLENADKVLTALGISVVIGKKTHRERRNSYVQVR